MIRLRRLASRSNPKIKEWAGLSQKPHRDALGLTLADGAKLSAEGLSADPSLYRPKALLVSDSGAGRPEAGALFSRAGELGIERYSVADDSLDKVSGLKNGDGIALILEYVPGIFSPTGDGCWLVAAGVQDPGNAGALTRIALAVGARGCLFVEGADPHSPKFLRGSMGASFRLPCVAMTSDEFRGVWNARLLAASANKGVDYRRCDYAAPLGILIGGERGIPEALASMVSDYVHIPLSGGVESLNLAVAAGVIMFESRDRSRAAPDAPH